VVVPAEVQLDHQKTAHITALVAGQVKELRAVRGDRVKEGQVLAVLGSEATGQRRADLTTARATLTQAQAAFERQEQLSKEGIGSRKSLIAARGELERARAAMSSANSRLRAIGGGRAMGVSNMLRSPIDGQVIDCMANRGELVPAGYHLYVVADLNRVWVVGRVYQQDITEVRVGVPAAITLQAYPGRTWRGKVSYVAATLDQATRTLSIRVELENPGRLLKPGMFGTITLPPADKAELAVAVVPDDAVQRLRGGHVVFVPAGAAGDFRVQQVLVGRRALGKVELVSGLKTGDPVVISGTYTLKSELLRGELSSE
jgi:cobalt-zinc-cadmium efflux system membrane fusion protein